MFNRKLSDEEKLQQRANLLFNKTQEKYPKRGFVKTDYSLGSGMDDRDDDYEENLNEALN